MAVIICVDPHKATHTAVAISGSEQELARRKVRAGGTQAEQLLAWAEPFGTRTWAIEAVGHSEVLCLLAKRNTDIGNHRTRLVCRMHALLAELVGGGIAKEINASDVDRFLADLSPANAVEQTRYDLALRAPGVDEI